MNQIEAAKETYALAQKRLIEWTLDWGMIQKLPESMQQYHLAEMLEKMIEDNNPQGEGFSEAKLGRWLGWMQASFCAMGVLSLEDAKAINMKWSDSNVS